MARAWGAVAGPVSSPLLPPLPSTARCEWRRGELERAVVIFARFLVPPLVTACCTEDCLRFDALLLLMSPTAGEGRRQKGAVSKWLMSRTLWKWKNCAEFRGRCEMPRASEARMARAALLFTAQMGPTGRWCAESRTALSPLDSELQRLRSLCSQERGYEIHILGLNSP